MKTTRKRYFLIAIVLLLMFQVLAQNVLAVDNIQNLNKELDKQQVNPVSSPNLWLDSLKLIVILGLIVGAAWSIIRIFARQVVKRRQGTWLHVVDEVMLGQNRGVVVCEVGQRLYALGVSEHNISLLFEVDNPDLLRQISESPYDLDAARPGAKSIVQTIIDKLGINGGSITRRYDFHSLMEEQLGRLKRMSPDAREDQVTNKKRSGENDQL